MSSKFKRVVGIYPYFQEVPIYEFFPPIGLEYVAAAIEDLVQDVKIFDLRREEDYADSLRSEIRNGVDLFCVSVNWHYEYESVCKIIRSLPSRVTTVVGGKFATENVEGLFKECPNIDVVVRGDGEDTLREFVETGSPDGVMGLSFRRNGSLVHNDNRELKPVSDTLIPNRKGRRYQYRVSYKKVDLGYSFDSMVASRGCPYNCAFCSFKRNPLGQKRDYSARSPESVVQELKQIDARLVAFLDDNFFVDIDRAERICDLIIQEKLDKYFIVNARISIAFHPRLLKKMRKAGFRLLMIGIESAQDKSLKQLRKGFKTDDVRRAFEILRKSRMMTAGYFIVGLIGENKDEMLEIGKFAGEIGVDFIHLNRLRFEKYSALADLLETEKDYYVGDKNRIYSRRYGPKEINAILKTIRNRFFHPGKIGFLVWKGVRIGFPDWRILLRAIFKLPRITLRLLLRKRERRQRMLNPREILSLE
jgi:magnesium-protoporphyrin IX monomethyl ester (oxidative) cyclase